MSTPNPDPHVLESKKTWIPLENNADVMTPLVHQLGLKETYHFEELYSFTDTALLDTITRPAHALLFLYPTTDISEAAVADEDAATPEDGHGPLHFQQWIGNACGTFAAIHCVIGGLPPDALKHPSFFGALVMSSLTMKAPERAQYLYDSGILEEVYGEAARRGDSRVPDAREQVLYAFTAYVKDDEGKVWELEGRRKGAVLRGQLGPGEDMLSDKARELTILRHVNREKASEGRYSCLALVGGD